MEHEFLNSLSSNIVSDNPLEEIKKYIDKNDQIRINLGCGSDIKEGWLNLDEYANSFCGDKNNINKQNLIQYDCRNGFPIKNNSVNLIYSSHFFEHLTPTEALNLYKDSFRILKNGGIFRIALPNIIKIMKAIFYEDLDYLTPLMHDERVMFKIEGKPNKIDFLNYCIYQHYEHKYIYDSEKVKEILEYVGFTKVTESEFNLDCDIDNEVRKKYSFYVEATK